LRREGETFYSCTPWPEASPRDEEKREVTIEIIAIGNELVTGRTRDTNSCYMAGRLFQVGLKVNRIVLVDDSVIEIRKEIERAKKGGVKFLVTTGGLGPTPDDVTLRGVAKALNLSLVEDEKAVEMVREKYDRLHREGRVPRAGLTKERLKMATVPEGCTLFENREGVAPGVMVTRGEFTLFSLPGVPMEMEAMFDKSVFPRIVEARDGWVMVSEKVRSLLGDESLISRIVSKIHERFPRVYVKPKPERFARGLKMDVEFIVVIKDGSERADLEEAVAFFKALEKKEKMR